MLAALHCIKVVRCAALPIPHTEIPKQSCAAFASSKASARVRERQGERGWGEQRTRDGVILLKRYVFPQRSFLYLFLDSKLNHSINRWAYFVMIMYSAFQPLCVVYLIFFTRALSLPLVFHFHFLLADQLDPPPTLPSLTFLTHFKSAQPPKTVFLNRFD